MEDETKMIGGLVMLAIAIIVGAILLQGSAQNVGSVVNTNTLKNYTVTASGNGTSFYVTTFRSITPTSITNTTTGAVIAAGNYTVTNNVINPSTGDLATRIAVAAGSTYGGATWAINGNAEPLTYADSGGRAMANLIIIMMALALVAVVVVYAAKSYME